MHYTGCCEPGLSAQGLLVTDLPLSWGERPLVLGKVLQFIAVITCTCSPVRSQGLEKLFDQLSDLPAVSPTLWEANLAFEVRLWRC